MAISNNFYTCLFGNNTLFQTTESHTGVINNIKDTVSVIVVISEPNLSEDDLAQMKKILSACKLQEDEVLIVSTNTKWQHLRSFSKIQHILLFGSTANDFGVPIQLPLHYPITFDEKIWIATASIAAMQQQPSIKAELWNKALKPTFAP